MNRFFITCVTILLTFPGFSNAEVLRDSIIIQEPDTLRNDTSIQYYASMLGINPEQVTDPMMLEYMVSWLGTPYRYGANSKIGTDCSGFVGNVFSEICNITLSRTSAAMFHDVELVRKKEDLIFGDIVFFKIKKGRISHAGIYIGEGKFIHASRSRGVRVDTIEDGYFRKYYYSGGRPGNREKTAR